MTTNVKNILKEAYDKYAQEREKTEMDDWKAISRNTFLQLIKEEGKTSLLEIGAGHGRDSIFFMQNGLNVVAIDLSPEMVKLCGNKGIDSYEMDFYNLSEMNKEFDAVWAMNCLLHVEKRYLHSVLEQIMNILHPSGLFFMGVYGGVDREGIWEEDIYTPHRFFSSYTDESIKVIVQEYFKIESFNRIETGGKNHFQSIILRK